MPVAIVAFYAGLNGFIAVALAINVSRLRGSHKVSIGTGGNPALEQATRAHGNFVENAPLVLLLMLVLALGGASAFWLHGLGIALTLGRVLHAQGLLSSPGESPGRLLGITLTWITLIVAAIRCLILGVAAL